jgi:hypothetical protein
MLSGGATTVDLREVGRGILTRRGAAFCRRSRRRLTFSRVVEPPDDPAFDWPPRHRSIRVPAIPDDPGETEQSVVETLFVN